MKMVEYLLCFTQALIGNLNLKNTPTPAPSMNHSIKLQFICSDQTGIHHDQRRISKGAEIYIKEANLLGIFPGMKGFSVILDRGDCSYDNRLKATD